jgi:hypothetical protein
MARMESLCGKASSIDTDLPSTNPGTAIALSINFY